MRMRNRLCPGARGGARATIPSFCGWVFSPHFQENNKGKESVTSSCKEQAPYSPSCGLTLGGGVGGMGGETTKAPSIQRDMGLSSSLQPQLFEWTAFSVNEQKLGPRIAVKERRSHLLPCIGLAFPLLPLPRFSHTPQSPKSAGGISCLERIAVGAREPGDYLAH